VNGDKLNCKERWKLMGELEEEDGNKNGTRIFRFQVLKKITLYFNSLKSVTLQIIV
jgi:hypothetical protein